MKVLLIDVEYETNTMKQIPVIHLTLWFVVEFFKMVKHMHQTESGWFHADHIFALGGFVPNTRSR